MDGAVLGGEGGGGGGEGSSENCEGRENGTYVSIPMHRCTSAACQLTNGMTVMPPKCRPGQALSRTRENSHKGCRSEWDLRVDSNASMYLRGVSAYQRNDGYASEMPPRAGFVKNS